LNIELNYSLDQSHFFNTPAKKNLMQEAANAIVGDISTNLQPITPSGPNSWTATATASPFGFNASFKNLTIPANTLVVYVLGRGMGGGSAEDDLALGIAGGWSATGTQSWINLLSTRGVAGASAIPPHGFGTWGGAVLFDTSHTNWFFGQTTQGIKSNQADFLTAAEHEIAHVLGFGLAGSWFTDVNRGAGTFIGPTTERVNHGKPVPLDASSGFAHWAEGTMSDGHQAAMSPQLPGGTRQAFTTLDFAGLADLGWQITAPVFQLAAPAVTAPWGAKSITLTIVRSGGTGAATVHYATANGAAQAGVDYTATSGVAAFAPGQTSATITIPLLNNRFPDTNLSFGIKLSAPTAFAVLGARSSANATIQVTAPPKVPVLTTATDTGVSHADGITADNGTSQAPLAFTISGVTPANGFVRLYRDGQLVAGPIQAHAGTATVTVSGGPPLPDGTYKFTATDAVTATSPQTAPSPASNITIETSLKVIKITPASGVYRSLPTNQVVVTFNHPLAGVTPDQPQGGGFAGFPFAVRLTPRGPSGAFAPPSGLDSGSTPLHATLVYHVNPNGTSTVTLTPRETLSTDVYEIAASGNLHDPAGNPLVESTGTAGDVTSTFQLTTTPPNPAPLSVVSVTTLHASVNIANNATIPQPDTIAIAFNKPVDFLLVNPSTVRLLAGPSNTPVAEAVAYSPTTKTIYLTPEAPLAPGTSYTVRVDGSVTDDQAFPNPDAAYSLGHAVTRTFRVSAPGIGAGTAPFRILTDSHGAPATSPAPGVRRTPFGYASIHFSEPIDTGSLERFTIVLSNAAGGLNGAAFDAADSPLNARLAFNPNTGSLIIVPTVVVDPGMYLYTISDVQAANGNHLFPPGRKAPIYIGFTFATA
jgi:hypothetical protein